MAFDSFSEFLSMGTHGPYVWSVYAISTTLLVGAIVQTVTAKRTQIKRLQKILAQEKNKNASS